MPKKKINQDAKRLSLKGASKGGKARASVLTKEQRSEIARQAVRARWAKVKGQSYLEGQVESALEQAPSATLQKPASVPVSLFRGTLLVGDVSFACHVLDNGKRVIAQREVVRLLTGVGQGNLNRYLTSVLQNYLDISHVAEQTVQFAIPGTQFEATGYEATLIVEICDAYLKARDDDALAEQQKHLAKRSEIILRACAKVGIIALIDEATGYQAVREKNALQLKLQAFIAEDMQEWARMFPEDFWYQLARLENVHYSPRSRPLRWGKYVMAFVYDAVDKDVGKELRKKNPNPHHGQNHHQWLKDFGREKVRDHLNQVLGVMKTCRDMAEFNKKFGYVFKKNPLQLTFFDLVEQQASRN
jgi:P63C domain